MGTHPQLHGFTLIGVVRIQLQQRIILLRHIVNQVVHLQTDAHLLFLIDISSHETFGMENIFRTILHVIIIITQAEASLESKLYRQVLVAGHHSYIPFTQCITLCDGPVLHPFIHRRHIIKDLRSKGSSQFQRHFPEIMPVIQ